MKRTMMMLLAILMMLSVCMTASAESGKRVAKDGAQMQTDDPTMPTRLPPENGTKILLHFGDTVIPGVLNDSETAQALIAKLPYTQHMSRYSHDFCGVTEDLPYNEKEEHYGWLNGDIDYATDAPYFTILFEDQDESEIYGSQVNIGVITCPLADIAALNGSYDVLIELDESEEEGASMMQMEINDTPVTVAWENNESVSALKELAISACPAVMCRPALLPATSCCIPAISWWCSTGAIPGPIPGWDTSLTRPPMKFGCS